MDNFTHNTMTDRPNKNDEVSFVVVVVAFSHQTTYIFDYLIILNYKNIDNRSKSSVYTSQRLVSTCTRAKAILGEQLFAQREQTKPVFGGTQSENTAQHDHNN